MSASVPRLLAASLILALPSVASAADIRIQNANFAAGDNKIIVKGVLDAIPPGTAVALIQDSNGRMLARDADGNKQFGFQVTIPAGQAVPCHLRVEAGGEKAYVQVRHSPTCGQQALTLEGQVVDDPIPFATVTVTVGGVTYTTIANENGSYSLDIATASLAELVTIEAVGRKFTNGQSVDVDFVSLAGSFSKLLEDSSGGVISSDANQKVNVTNVSSAEYVLLVEANGGTAPTTVEELQQAETQVDATELLQLAAVIKLVVDGGYDLPAGYKTVLDFIAAPAAVKSFVAEVEAADPGALDAVVEDILGSGGLVAGFRVQDVPARYFITAAVEPGFVPRSGELLEFSSNRPGDCATAADGCSGLFMYRDVNGRPFSELFGWYLDNGVLEIQVGTPTPTGRIAVAADLVAERPDARMTDGTLLSACDAPDFVFNFQEAILGFAYTRYNDGAAVDGLFRRARLSRTGFTSPTCADGVVRTLADYVYEDTGQIMARDSGAIAPKRFVRAGNATGAADEIVVEGQWAMQVYARLRLAGFSPPFPRVIFSDNVTLSPGGGASALIASEDGIGPSSWNIDTITSDLLLTYPDGWIQRVVVTDALDANGDGSADEFGAFSILTGPGGERFASSDLTFKRDESLVADASVVRNPPGSYWQTVVNAWPSASWEDAPGGGRQLLLSGVFGWHAAPVGEAFQGSYGFPDAVCTNGTWFRRGLTNFELEFTGSLNVVNMNYTVGSQNRLRIWSAYSAVNIGGQRRLYVLELETFPLLAGEPKRFIPRPNIYREMVEPTVTRGMCAAGFTPTPQP